MIVTGSMGFEYKEIDGRLWANMDEVQEALASLTYRAVEAVTGRTIIDEYLRFK